jgi:hypothetical protein
MRLRGLHEGLFGIHAVHQPAFGCELHRCGAENHFGRLSQREPSGILRFVLFG